MADINLIEMLFKRLTLVNVCERKKCASNTVYRVTVRSIGTKVTRAI